MPSQRTVEFGRWVALSVALAGIVLVYRLLTAVNPTIVALSLLLLILVTAANWSLRHAVGLSLAATACYNFFFLPPIGTFTIADPQNWLALLVFLTVSVIASRLSQRVRAEANDARSRQREVELLLTLSRDLLQAESLADLAASLPQITAHVTLARSAILYLLDGDLLFAFGNSSAEQEDAAACRYFSLSLAEALSVHAGDTRETRILRDTQLSKETYEAIGSLLSIALDRARALEELAAGEAAKQGERLRTLILDSITHDLRTPLTSIKVATDTLLDDPGISPDDRAELLTVIAEETDRLNQLVAQAVEMAQLDTGQIQVHTKPVSVEALVNAALETSAGRLVRHTVVSELPPLPIVMADTALTEKALCNLLENAAKYSVSGTSVLVSATAENGYVRIAITDQGIGVAASEQALIFDRFYRVQSQTSRISGTGMGLSISRAIFEAQGGTLRITSALGHGSTFSATLPTA
jgi:two-component system sensor histidine kinase KdpD